MAILFLFIFHKFYAITAGFWRIFKFSANSCDKNISTMTNSRCVFVYCLVKSFFWWYNKFDELWYWGGCIYVFWQVFGFVKARFPPESRRVWCRWIFQKFLFKRILYKKDFCRIHGRYRTARLSCVWYAAHAEGTRIESWRLQPCFFWWLYSIDLNNLRFFSYFRKK